MIEEFVNMKYYQKPMTTPIVLLGEEKRKQIGSQNPWNRMGHKMYTSPITARMKPGGWPRIYKGVQCTHNKQSTLDCVGVSKFILSLN